MAHKPNIAELEKIINRILEIQESDGREQQQQQIVDDVIADVYQVAGGDGSDEIPYESITRAVGQTTSTWREMAEPVDHEQIIESDYWTVYEGADANYAAYEGTIPDKFEDRVREILDEIGDVDYPSGLPSAIYDTETASLSDGGESEIARQAAEDAEIVFKIEPPTDAEITAAKLKHESVLSSQEAGVAARVLHGYTREQIANELEISEETVRTYQRRATGKIKSANRTIELISIDDILAK